MFFFLFFCGFFGCFVAFFSLNSYFWYCSEFYGIVYEVSYNFYAFSSYLDLHASFPPHSIFLLFFYFYFCDFFWIKVSMAQWYFGFNRLQLLSMVLLGSLQPCIVFFSLTSDSRYVLCFTLLSLILSLSLQFVTFLIVL